MSDSSQQLLKATLWEQSQLSAVEEFSRAHDAGTLSQERYRNLMPVSKPTPGTQYAFEVDLDQCSGCKACVTACHALNGLDDDEAWRHVGGLQSDDVHTPFQQAVTTACHHCVDPACLNGCPVLAYEKDPITGIVRHLDDQCIGCQYCILQCPYEVPQYSKRRGIVRKCDLCTQRLAADEAPACVQACPNEAIRIQLIQTASWVAEFRPQTRNENEAATEQADRGDNLEPSFPGASPTAPAGWLPASPDPAMTLPTTRYVSKRGLPARLLPIPLSAPKLADPHWPLVWMLIFTQMGVGTFLATPFLPSPSRGWLTLVGLGTTLVGLAASVFHLGQPLKAWRSFLGWRRSWMSREIIVFGFFIPMAGWTTLAHGSRVVADLRSALLVTTFLAGLAAVFCSGMIYHDTRRPCWRGFRSVGRFFATSILLGLGVAWTVSELTDQTPMWLPYLVAVAGFLKFAGEARALQRAEDPEGDETWPRNGEAGAVSRWVLAQSARRHMGPLAKITRFRMPGLLAGGTIFPLAHAVVDAPELAVVSLALSLAAELAERYSFFRGAVSPRMPGV